MHPSLDRNCCLPCGTSRKDLTLSPIMERGKWLFLKGNYYWRDPCSFTSMIMGGRVYQFMGVSKNRGTPKSSILIGVSIINHPFWWYPYFWKHPYQFISIYIRTTETPPDSPINILAVFSSLSSHRRPTPQQQACLGKITDGLAEIETENSKNSSRCQVLVFKA